MKMNDSEKVKMFLNIGDQKISVTVPFNRQEFVRDVEDGIEQLYRQWRRQFPLKTDREILAMVTFQFASHYADSKDQLERAVRRAEECLRRAENQEQPEDADEDDWLLD